MSWKPWEPESSLLDSEANQVATDCPRADRGVNPGSAVGMASGLLLVAALTLMHRHHRRRTGGTVLLPTVAARVEPALVANDKPATVSVPLPTVVGRVESHRRWLTAQLRRALARRAVVGAVSGLLMLLALVSAGSEHTPGFARILISDDDGEAALQVPRAASGWEGSSPPRVEGAGAPRPIPAPTPQPAARLDPLPAWVQVARATTLWVRSSGTEPSLALVERVRLQVLGQPENSRLPVYYDDGKPNGRRLGGWVETAHVAPIVATGRIVASSRGGSRPTPDISTPERFIAEVAEAAQESQRETRVLPSVTIAQAILESNWGKSLLSKKGHNYFGIKATSGPGTAGVISMDTWEVLGGRNVTVRDGFRAYNNVWESVMDHGRFLAKSSRYAAAFKVLDDAREFARRIHAAGYATDPAYSTKLINFMDRYNLYQYDLPLP